MDAQQFKKSFDQSIKALEKSEKITRSELLTLSRITLDALHSDEDNIKGDIGYINRLLKVLTPVNKKTAILYFKEWTGFTLDADAGQFGHKSKKHYDTVKASCLEFLTDPMNNIWTWADRNIEIEKKEFTLDKVGKMFSSTLKKANEAGYTQAQVMQEVLKQGIELDTILALLGSMYDVNVEQAQA